MTPIKIIPSATARDKRAYELHQDWSPLWDRRGNTPLCINIATYDTYGDSLTKHSPSYCVQWPDLTDVCLSFTDEILRDPQAEEWRVLVSPQSAFGIIAPFGGQRDWLTRLFLAHDIQDAHEYAGGGYIGGLDKIFKDLDQLAGDWRQAYCSFRYALESVEKLRVARQMLDCAVQNSKPAAPEAVAA